MEGIKNIPVIDVERVKAYNESLKAYVEKSAKLKAELEFVKNELEKLCQEVSMELGREVNMSNIEQVYMEVATKIQDDLQVGEEILNRIKAEERGKTAEQEAAATTIGVEGASQYVQQVYEQQVNTGGYQQPGQPWGQLNVANTQWIPQNGGYGQPNVGYDKQQQTANKNQSTQRPLYGQLPNMFGGHSINI